MAKKKTKEVAKFTNEVKVKFLGCDTKEKLDDFLNEYEMDSFDDYGNNILHYYLNSMDGFSLDWKIVIPAILSKGLDINQKQSKGQFGRTPLHCVVAFLSEEKEMAEYLIEQGADVNATDVNGNSILTTAVFQYREPDGFFIELLLKHHADVYQENLYGVSAIGLARNIANTDVRKFFEGMK